MCAAVNSPQSDGTKALCLRAQFNELHLCRQSGAMTGATGITAIYYINLTVRSQNASLDGKHLD